MRLPSWLRGLRTYRSLSLPVGRRRDSSARDALWGAPNVRRLEPRRVLNASVLGLVVPSGAVEGDTVHVAAEASGDGALRFDWNVSQGTQLVAQGSGDSFQFIPAEEGIYEVGLVISDAALTSDSVTASIAVTDIGTAWTGASNGEAILPGGVDNSPPTNLFLQPVGMVEEGQVATLRLSFHDPDEADTHTVLINWGDGTPIQEVGLEEGQRSLSIGHLYSDDNPTETPEDSNLIDVTVIDGAQQSTSEEISVLVKNDEPQIAFINEVDPVEVGDTATLRFGFADAGAFDIHTVTIDWGDGTSTVETLPFGAADATFTHTYLSAPADGSEFYTVNITVTDDDGQHGEGVTTIEVLNLRPMNLNILPVSPVNEQGLATLRFSFTDSRLEEQHVATIDWGDGESTLLVLPVGDRNLTTTHRYRDDNPSGTSQDPYTIAVTVHDSGDGSVTDTATVLVRNLAPTALVTELTPTVNEGQNAFLNVRFADEGLFDVHTVMIEWGDGTSTVEVLPVGTRDRTFAHQYRDDNPSGTAEDLHTVSVTVMDDDGGMIMGTDSTLVRNVAPTSLVTSLPNVVNEGESAQLDVSFADDGLLDEHTVTIDWGDGTITAETLPVGTRDASFSHIYNDVEFGGASEVSFQVLITVADDDGANVMGSDSLVVQNTAPMNLLTTLTGAINEGGTARLNLEFTDANEFDVHTVTIDWGDGSTTVETLPVGSRDRSFLHVYRDDNPTATPQDIYPVIITLDDGNQSISTNDSILVRNLAPTALVTEITPMVVEGQTAFMNVRFADEGVFDVHTVTIDWGDGTSTVETLPVGTRDRTFAHQYLDDDPSATSEDTYSVSVTVVDDDGGSIAGSDSIVVKNAAPSEFELELTPEIVENGTAVLTVRFVDQGIHDSHTMTIDWGDGTVETLPVVPNGAREASFEHQYLDDNPSGTMQDNYIVSVSLMDDDGGQSSDSASILVINDAPRDLQIILSPAAAGFVAGGSLAGGQGTIGIGDGTISGVKFEDINGNGARDVGLVRGDEPDVVFVIDVSGSTTAPFEGSPVGDRNNDGAPDTILDAQIAGFSSLVEQLIDLGFGDTAQIGIVAFSSSGFILDMDPSTPGVQSAITPLTDGNGDGTLDVVTLLEGLFSGGTTNFESALTEAAELLRDLGTSPENGNVIFLSDGFPNSNAITDEVDDLRTVAGNLRAFGVGEGASLASLQLIDPTASIFTTTDELLAVFGGLSGGESPGGEFSERGIAGVQIYLDLNDNGALDAGEPTAVTLEDDPETADDETGRYSFHGLSAGAYVVREVVPNGFMQTAPGGDGAHRITLELDQSLTNLDFGNQQGAMILEDGVARLDLQFQDDGTLDVHTVTIDWGDGSTTTETLEIGARTATFFHQYLDDAPSATVQDMYVVSVTVADDDAKDGSGVQSILVKNVAPEITAEMPMATHEGTMVELTGFLADVGTLDTHTATIDWGDGSQTLLGSTQLISGESIAHSHVYADDGTYEVIITVMDDDGSTVTETFQVIVENVRPTLTVVGDQEFDVGEQFEIVDLGTFTDPGYDNPVNPHEQPGGSQENFYYEIHWGDGGLTTGTIESHELDQIGDAGQPTIGSFDGSHRYLRAGEYTVTVLLADDDMLAEGASASITSLVLPGELEGQFVVATFTITVDEQFFVLPPSDRTDPEAFLFDFGQGGGLSEASRSDLDYGAPQNGSVQISVQVPDLRAVYEELVASPERFLLLQVIEIDGTPGRTFRLDPKVLLNLREFFSNLPDNDYEVYVVQPDLPDRDDWRLVVKVTVRGSQAVDVTDESDGARDKPPGDEERIEMTPLRELPMLEVSPGSFAPLEDTEGAVLERRNTLWPSGEEVPLKPWTSNAAAAALWQQRTDWCRVNATDLSDDVAQWLPIVGLSAAAEAKWSVRVGQALAQANNTAWQRLRCAGRRRRAIHRTKPQ